MDPSSAVISGAIVEAINVDTSVRYSATTNSIGQFTIPNLLPSTYKVEISKPGFRTIVRPDIVVHVQDILALNFTLPIGAASEIVTVEGGAPLVNTQDASVSTVIDRNFAENLPLNGRSFQTLIQLTPGVVLTRSNPADGGQFSVNGQRPSANYFSVDGVGANIGMTPTTPNTANSAGGSLPGFSAQGGTNSLVSVDALQEFRIQTSTYAPEFGRSPGAQISIATRFGTNQFHGTLFDYLRNDVMDANDWFAGFKNNPPLPKPKERQNDFGGVLGGPLLKNRTFFFFSYEGLRLRTPQVALTVVPSLAVRQKATAAMAPILNAFPKPTGPDVLDSKGNPTGVAPFNASYSNQSQLDATSLRIDHRFNDRLSAFARYNYSPSNNLARPAGFPLDNLSLSKTSVQTMTIGALMRVSAYATNDLRFNFSRNQGNGAMLSDNFGGAAPLSSSDVQFPSAFNFQNGSLGIDSFDLGQHGFLTLGRLANNQQKQINLVDTFLLQSGRHSLKFGVDYRRLNPSIGPPIYTQSVFFSDVNHAAAGQVLSGSVQIGSESDLLFHNLGVFAQDTWNIFSRLTATYGLRWDVDFAPSTATGPQLLAVTNFDNLAQLTLAPSGTPIFNTRFANVAPRLGLAYEISDKQGWQTVLRGGAGIFFDLATQEVGQDVLPGIYPFGASKSIVGGTYPWDAGTAAPPIVSASNLSSSSALVAFDPNLKLPRIVEWNAALEQSLGRAQSMSMSYVGSIGRRLIGTEFVIRPNSNFVSAKLIGNDGTSDYHSLQLQYQHRLSSGFQTVTSYVWAHSIDTASASSNFLQSNAFSRQLDKSLNRGPSDFDIRHAFTAALTYDIPAVNRNIFVKSLINGWSLQNVIQARSAPPVDVSYSQFVALFNDRLAVRPDLVGGQPLYLYGAQYPGGKSFNLAAFSKPPINPANNQPLRQGDLSRNSLRGFGAWQWDFAVHRSFPLRENVALQFRAEFFNLLNHPNFGNPGNNLSSPSTFGTASQMLAKSFDVNNQGGGSFNPLYQIGGPRSAQLALKLSF